MVHDTRGRRISFGNVAEHADEALLGAPSGLPLWLAPLLGGTPGMARLLMAARPLGAFQRDAGAARSHDPAPAPEPPPTSLTEAAERIKSMETSGAQVIVEQYELADGSTVANVYIDGTIDWSPVWPRSSRST